MEHLYIPFQDIEYLSKSDKVYATEAEILRPFYKHSVNIATFDTIIQEKSKANIDRATLVEVLNEQYNTIETTAAVRKNIAALAAENTFTVITAHQPSLFTGPLYFIYKTISAINLAEQLNKKYPHYHIVPVFWLGSEDHDFEEISYAHLFGKKLIWQNDETGATGMMSTASLAPVLTTLKTILGNSDKAQKIYSIIEDCYTTHSTYATATFAFINALFQQYGLVVLLANHPKLKRVFSPVLQAELLEQPSVNHVTSAIQQKEAAGLKGQAHPRDINLFYMKQGIRERIVLEDGIYKVLNTTYTFDKTEMLTELQNHPERFSPNVILRPLFQEYILPNLAYIGGGGELAYWMERLTQFEHFGVAFPMLVRRNSVLWIDKGSVKRLNKLGLTAANVFQDVEVLVKTYVRQQATQSLNLVESKAAVVALYQNILEKATLIDKTLAKSVLAEKTKQLKVIQQLENRLMRAEKRKYDTAIKQLRNLKDKLFPNNGLQERHDNFLAFYLKYGDDFITTLKAILNPLNRNFVVIMDR